MNWFNRKPKPEPELQAPKPELTPGDCECGHSRCCHIGGIGACKVSYEPNSEDNKLDYWTDCACQVYIRDDDDDSDDPPSDPVDPEVVELEKLLEKK